MELRGSIALITGASKGLGRATALAFAREGASLALCARGPGELERVATDVQRLGADALSVVADLRSERDIERLVVLALDRFGRVDVLMNNASELGPTPLPFLTDYAPSAFDDVLRVNVVAPFRLTQSLIGGMLRRRRGVILNVSSDVSVTGYPGWGAYAVSKAALDGLTRTWAAELEGTGVRIHAVDPGDMDTAMHRAAAPEDDPAGLLDPATSARSFVRVVQDDALPSGRIRGADLVAAG
ncbi:MAG: SDR family oxidoreductase [Chloroflexota bacterium]|nr:SDR family oxidoreductase [Chloroflexota bacterium]